MDIKNFQGTRICVGTFPISFSIQAEAEHCNYAVSATFYPFCTTGYGGYTELREKDDTMKLFLWKFPDHEPITGHWADARIVWTNDPRQVLPLIGKTFRLGTAATRPQYTFSVTLYEKAYTILSFEPYEGNKHKYLCRLQPNDGGPVAEGILSCNKHVKAIGPAL